MVLEWYRALVLYLATSAICKISIEKYLLVILSRKRRSPGFASSKGALRIEGGFKWENSA